MEAKKVGMFMELAGQSEAAQLITADKKTRELGARLLLSEVLEYIIHGLGVQPVVGGSPIDDPDDIIFAAVGEPNKLEMVDGLADTAYTMYWNALAFGVPLEQAFDLVCDNNLEKFVALEEWTHGTGELPADRWHCDRGIEWPSEVESVSVIEVAGGALFAVGKDKNGKVRKPSSFSPVDLATLIG